MLIGDKQPLVSIIAPCYNGEKFIHRFLDSVLNQTYSNIEFIFINDGSTDKTEEIVQYYSKKFKSKGIKFKYIFQENKGQAAALNQGLKIFTGDYITWPDSDDILHKDNVKDRVYFLEENKKFNIVLCESILIDKKLNVIGTMKRIPPKTNDNLFYDLIIERNAYFAGGAYMIRASAFLNANPNRHIYESRGGQNWQILLPVLYKNKCGYLNKQLYFIYARPDSHSRQVKDLKGMLKRCDEHEDILINVIKGMREISNEDRGLYLELVKQKYARKRLRLASSFRNKDLIEKYYRIIKDNNDLTPKDKLVYLIGKNSFLYYVYKLLKAPLRFIMILKRRLFLRC